MSNFTKVHPIGAKLTHAQTDRTKMIGAFRKYANA